MSRFCSFALLLVTLVCSLGCPQAKPPVVEEKRPSGPFKLLVLDDPQLAEAIEREWKAREERPLELSLTTSTDLLKGDKIGADAVIYPPALLGEMMRREWIETLPESLLDNAALEIEDIFPAVRQSELQWKGATVAVPFGSPTLVLMVRPEVLEELELAVPETWNDYQACVEQIAGSRFCTGDDKAFDSPTLEPLASDWRGKLLLARSAAYAKNPSNYAVLFGLAAGEAMIGQPSFVKGAEDLRRIAATIPAELQSLTPAEVGAQFLAGKSALAIGWLPHKSDASQGKLDFAPDFVPIPGAVAYWNQLTESWEQRRGDRPATVPFLTAGGRIGSVSTGSPSLRDAALGLILLSALESATQVSPASDATMVYRNGNLAGVSQWVDSRVSSETANAYGEAMAVELSSNEAISFNLPGVDQYLQVLDNSVGAILNDQADPQQTLEKAAQDWDAITDKLGRKDQIKANSASLGIR
ncbi:ABC transporter substrate-binding protein [Blastopirellula sp. J2-11]|uniref:ABC transporter substrate-binding protein n=1 Tax=Blastopirellula sp. J2-11 TaxID=2943192 RepID=UPI0021C70DB5|nr:ABC transporter substrate-binding protein [Blastopirellula sp. J2-11]UUO04873.1 ABC transporter substrate-binding protein [Blastopirellula sp. J2-11]